NKVPDTKDTIKFKLDSQEITYTVDMFHDTLKQPVETPDNPFIAPVNIKVIESFMQTVGYQGVVDKDDIPLVSVYSIGNVLFRGMLISNAFLTDEIYATDDYAEYKTVVLEATTRIWRQRGDVASFVAKESVRGACKALQVMDTGCRLFLVGASFTQGTVSSIPIVGSISPEGFLPPILLLVVIIVTVVIVAVILVVVVVAIVGVVIVVAIIGVVVVVGGVSFIIKLSFVIIGVLVGPVFLLGLLVPAIVAAYASRAAETLSATSFLMAA
ncbi:hypothetical protein Tco_0926387, partial [Tanacetum coccineum]